MTRHSPRLAACAASAHAPSLPTDCRLAGAAPRPAGLGLGTLLRRLRGMLPQRSRVPRLAVEELSPHRLRDLGLLDGRDLPRRHH